MFDWIVQLVGKAGYLGIALLMFLENVFPPIPSELIMPLAGFSAAQGELHLAPVVLAGLAGSLAGALLWYWIGTRADRRTLRRWAASHGRWLTLHPGEVDAAFDLFARHSRATVFWGRLIPGVRTVISAPAGTARMSMGPFLFWTSLGAGLWTTGLTVAGYLLESQYARVEEYLNPVSTAVVVLAGLWYLWRVIRFDPSAG